MTTWTGEVNGFKVKFTKEEEQYRAELDAKGSLILIGMSAVRRVWTIPTISWPSSFGMAADVETFIKALRTALSIAKGMSEEMGHGQPEAN